jgi:hypothetical protein
MTENEIIEFKNALAGIKYGREFLTSMSVIPNLLDSMEENLRQLLKSIKDIKEILKPFESSIEVKREGWKI